MDREKVISGLEHCRKYGALCGNDCNGHYEYTDNLQDIIKANNHRKDCPYGKCKTGCVVTLVDDALALLKEQKAIKRTSRKGTNGFSIVWTCGACGSDLHPNNAKAKYCSNCGQVVKWE